MLYEVHITCDKPVSLSKVILNIPKLKFINIEALSPTGEALYNEHMTSYVFDSDSRIRDARKIVLYHMRYLSQYTRILRTKIEVPPIMGWGGWLKKGKTVMHNFIERSLQKETLYAEAHYTAVDNSMPLSRNLGRPDKPTMATERIFNKRGFAKFVRRHQELKHEVELCIFDTNYCLDRHWFSHYSELDKSAFGVY